MRFNIDGAATTVRLTTWQAFVWVSVARRDARQTKLTAAAVFPAIVDTGCTESFLLHEWHLEKWAGIPFHRFEPAGKPKLLLGHKCPTILIDVWLHPFQPGAKEPPVALAAATKLQMSSGGLVSTISCSRVFPIEGDPPPAGVFQNLMSLLMGQSTARRTDPVAQWTEAAARHTRDDVPFNVYPRLPLIGMKLIHANRWKLTVEGRRGTFTIQRQDT